MDFTATMREFACRTTVGRRAAPTGTILAGMYDSACPTDRERGGLRIGRSPPTITCRHLCLGSSRVCLSGCRRRGDVAASLTDRAAKLAAIPAGASPANRRSPVTVVVITSNGEGDQSVESLVVKVPEGWGVPVRSVQGGEQPGRP